MTDGAILEVRGLAKRFGGVVAVDGLGFDVGEGEILGLVGPNGSGKSTVFGLVSHTVTADRGRVVLAGRDVTGRKPWQIAAAGIARTYQQSRLIWPLSAVENVMLAGEATGGRRSAGRMPRAGVAGGSERARAASLLQRFRLLEHADVPAAHLSVGQHKLLSLACALARPMRVLLLDEPAAQLAKDMVAVLGEVVSELRRAGIGIVIVEHDLQLIRRLCDRVLVISQGREVACGEPCRVLETDEVRQEFLR